MEIVDPHHHLWDLERNPYPWLKPETAHAAGDLTPICRDYLLGDFLADARHQRLVKSVHLQAEMDRSDPVRETAWLQAIADAPGSGGFPHGIVAFADLADPGVEAVLERHCEHANMRGIRYILNHEDGEPVYSGAGRGDWLRDPAWQRGFALLARYGLSFDLQVFWHQMADGAALAARFPETQIIVDHTGMPRRLDRDYLAGWRAGMRTLAAAPNVACKVSGLAMFHHDWTTQTIRPLVLDAIEIIGTERCMFASNFPVDKLHGDYDRVWSAFDQITTAFSADERRALFHDNAVRFYRL